MKNYELTYLISPDLSEEELKSLQEKISSLIQAKGGTLIEGNFPIKKGLVYPANKKGQAFLATINFYLSNGCLADLEKELKQDSKILRYLILTKPKTAPPAAFRKKMVFGKTPTSRKKAAGEKVEFKEIEKKLEEILGET